MKKILLFSAIFCLMIPWYAAAQVTTLAKDSVNIQVRNPPALSSIKKADLKRDIFAMAGDKMRGRRAGTIDALRSAAWVAEQAREAGLEPAGENDTYFQFFSMYRSVVGKRSTLRINNMPVALWKDAWITSPVEANLEEPVVWLDSLADTTASLNGKVIAMNLRSPDKLPAKGMSLWAFRYALSAIRQQSAMLKKQGASAIILVADSTAASAIPYLGLIFQKGDYELTESSAASKKDTVPVIFVRQQWAQKLGQPNARLSVHIQVNNYTYPSANVIAKAPGSDADLKQQYVLFSAHHDHEGVGLIPVKGDSIWNGADDNASTSVALLAIARAWVKSPGKRSALFIWHGAEERGLFGSTYFVKHPTVKKEAIVAVLNGDLIGRNDPDSAALLGVTPPHRNSKDLVDVAMEANRQLTKFTVDTTWDASDHPEHWYFRSDHLPYARAGIPALFFSSLLHSDYHTPQDNPDRINIDKLAKMTQWMYDTGWNVSNREIRPALDTKDE